MPLREQPLPLVLAGLNTKLDPKLVPHTQLLDCQNAVFSQGTSLTKRWGYSALSTLIQDTGQSYGTPVGLGRRGSELVAFGDGKAYSYRPSADRWALTGEVSSVVASTTPIARSGTVQAIPDVAVRDGVQVVAWEDSRGGVWCSVLEEATGHSLLAQFQLDADGRHPRCVYADHVIHVLWTRDGTSQLWIASVNTAAPAVSPAPSMLTDTLSATNHAFDAESCGPGVVDGQEPAVVAWADDRGGFRVGFLTAGGVLGSPTTGLSSVATYADVVSGAVAVAVDRYSTSHMVAVTWVASEVNVRFLEAGDLETTIRVASLGSTFLTPSRLTCCFGRLVDESPGLWWAVQVNDAAAARTDRAIIRSGVAIATASTYDAAETVLRGHTLLSRAFYDGPELLVSEADGVPPTGDVFAAVAHGVRFFTYAAVIRLSGESGLSSGAAACAARLVPGEGIATHLRRIAAGPTGFQEIRHLSSVIDVDRVAGDTGSRKHGVPLSYRIQLDTAGGDQFSEVGVKFAILDFDSDTSFQTAELGRGLYLASACPQHYDGATWSETGYHAAPDWGYNEDGSAVEPDVDGFASVSGGDVPNGTHLYKLSYEDIDAQGEIDRGPVSASVLVRTSGSNGTVRIALPCYRLTAKRRVRICVWRAIVDAEGADETIAFYRVTGVDPSVTTGANCLVVNDPTVDTISFDDALSDEDLLNNEPLYTNGGIRSNDPAPWSGGCIAGGKSRLFWTDPSDPHMVRFSKTINDDASLEAPSSFSMRVDPYGGRIVGIWVMDDVVYVGKETAVYAFGGSGPEDAPDVEPQQNSFTSPELVTTDVGLESPASIGQTPIGTVFKSSKGIMLLGRDRGIQRVGAMVDGYVSQRVVRATLLPDRPQIVMLTNSGRTLLFDYERGLWSTFTNHEGWDAAVVDGVFYYLRTDGRVFQEQPGTYADAGLHIPMVIETAWIKLAGYLQGLQSVLWVYLLGTYLSPHTLRLRFRRDYGETLYGPIDMDVNTNVSPSTYGSGPYGSGLYGSGGVDPAQLYQRRAHLNQTCQAIQFRLEDLESGDDFGASFELTELLIVGGVLAPRSPLGQARSG